MHKSFDLKILNRTEALVVCGEPLNELHLLNQLEFGVGLCMSAKQGLISGNRRDSWYASSSTTKAKEAQVF